MVILNVQRLISLWPCFNPDDHRSCQLLVLVHKKSKQSAEWGSRIHTEAKTTVEKRVSKVGIRGTRYFSVVL